MFTINLFF
ncbi:hypothetical protein LINPERPRIM_LOCUS38292 [Linum perenne]